MFDKIIQLLSFFFFGLAIWLITKEVDKVGLDHLIHLVLSTPFWVIILASCFIFANYLSLTGYDWTALDYIHQKLPFKTVFKTAAIGFAVSNTAGHAYAAGGAVRYLFYKPQGLTRLQILMVIAFESLSLFLGAGLIYVIALLLEPLNGSLRTYPYLTLLYSCAFLTVIAFLLYWYLIIKPKRTLTLFGVTIKAPSSLLTLKQLFVGFCDNFTLFLVFYILVRYQIETNILTVFIIFVIAQIIGLVSQVPGGMGVFEGLILYLFPHTLDQKGPLLAALVVFRVLYFFVPFILSILYITWIEIKKTRRKNMP